MMSSAILMTMGAEQSGKPAAAHDVENFDGPTFAQTLDERMGLSPAVPGKDSKVATLSETSKERTELTTKILVDSPDLAAGAKAKVFAGQLTPAQIESKGTNLAKAAATYPALPAGTKIQKKTEEAEMQAEPVGDIEESQTETPAIAQGAQAASLQTEGAIALEQTKGNQIHLPQIQIPVSKQEASATSRMQEAAPEKKAATKTQRGDASQPVVTAKNGSVTVPSLADETKSTCGVGVQIVVQTANPIGTYTAAASAVPATPAATSNVALNVEDGKSGAGPDVPSLPVGSPSGVATAANDGSGSKSALHGAKTSVSDRETPPVFPESPAVAVKPDAKEERSQAAAANAGDSDTKTRTTGNPPVAMVHALASGGEPAVGSATTVIAGLTKPSGGEGNTSTAGWSNGLREQDGSGGVTVSAEPMPRTLSASPTVLEVGIPDGTHGWLKVRAEMADGGVVNASVSAASPASQEMLHRELPSLTAYLQSEKVAVNTVVVHPAASTGPESRGSSTGPESGASGQTPQGRNQGGEQRQSPVNAATEDASNYQDLRGVGEDGALPLTAHEGGGWLSVRA
jgi:hypothetical protein